MRHWSRGPGHPLPILLFSLPCVLLPLPLPTHSSYTGAGLLSLSPAFCIQDLLPVSLKTTANLPSQLHLSGALPVLYQDKDEVHVHFALLVLGSLGQQDNVASSGTEGEVAQ